MGDRLKLERFYWFQERIKSRRYPNAAQLAERFGITVRTAQRDIEFMRDRMSAPLEYVSERRGYVYTDQSFEQPRLHLTEENIVSIALAVRLASSLPDAGMKQSLCSFLDELLGRTSSPGLCSSDIAELVSVKNIEYSKVSTPYFPRIAEALLKDL